MREAVTKAKQPRACTRRWVKARPKNPDRTPISPKHLCDIFFMRWEMSEMTTPKDLFWWKYGHF